MRKIFSGVLLLVAAMLLAMPVSGQIGGTGAIRGVVSDPSGAVVPAASVVATNIATEVKTTAQTTEAGNYVISPLPAGEYTVTVTAAGFQTVNQEHIMVDALSMVGLNLTLKVGSSSEQITVVDTPAQLNTVDARVGETVRNDVYMALPLFMGNAPRDPTAFASLMPGVPTNSGTYSFGDVSGAQGNSGEMYLEGMPISNPAIQGEVRNVSLGVSAEAIEQFQLETAGSPVMYGGQGAANFVLKSGTNHFHGAVYEYFRNTDLDARNFFAATRPPEHQNEFGENVGGPIKRNRIFFFQSYDGFRYITGSSPAYYTLPPMAERTGDFSAYPALIYDPLSLDCSKGPCSRTAFVGNIIPASRISPISKFLEGPLPPTDNSNITNNILWSNAYGFNSYSTTQKVDLNLTDKQRLFGLYSRGHRKQANQYRGGTLPIPYDSGSSSLEVDEITTTAQARHTYVVTPTILNQLSYSFARFFQPQINNTQDGNWAIKAGIKGLPAGGASMEFPSIAFAGSNAPTTWAKNHPVNEIDQSFNLQDNVQWTKGKHSITIGVQIAWTQINYANNRFGSQATWNFSNVQTEGFNSSGTAVTTTGNAYASYLLGALNSASLQDDAASTTGGRYRNYTEWFQDNFRVSSKLTLNIGLRYDIMTPYREVANRLSFFDPTSPNPAASGFPGILKFAGNGPDSCGCSTNIATYHGMIQPRVGLAYSFNSKTVFRAGYDMTYTHRGAVGGRGGGRQGTGILGFSAQPSWNSLDTYSPAFYWGWGRAVVHPCTVLRSDAEYGVHHHGSQWRNGFVRRPADRRASSAVSKLERGPAACVHQHVYLDGELRGQQRPFPGRRLAQRLGQPDPAEVHEARKPADVQGFGHHHRASGRGLPGNPPAVCQLCGFHRPDAAAIPAVSNGQRCVWRSGQLEFQFATSHGGQEALLRLDLQRELYLPKSVRRPQQPQFLVDREGPGA